MMLMSLCSCLMICSVICSSPVETMVMREDLRVHGLGYAQAFDVETPAAEQAGHSGEHARKIIHQIDMVCLGSISPS